MNQKSIFFSDVHIEASPTPRMARIEKFLKEVVSQYPNVFILGDLFDVWPGSRSFQFKTYDPYLNILKNYRDRGAKILYIEGNHDFKLGKKFSDRYGIEIVEDEIMRQFGEYKVHLSHGDLANTRDLSYLKLRKLLRRPWLHALLNGLPSAWVHQLGHVWSTQSRKRHVRDEAVLKRIQHTYREAAGKICERSGADISIMGHTHIPDDFAFIQSGRNCRYLNTGDWFKNFTYVEFDGAQFYTKKYL